MNIDVEGKVQFVTRSFVGKSAALLGITDSGKTNTAAVLIEELLASGLPMTICDIEGEYWGLKERFEILVAGRSEHTELYLDPENAGALAQISVVRGISVILDLSEYTEEESYTCLVEYFTVLWKTASQVKRPYQVVIEEAHEWLPEGMRTPLKALLTRIALRGRKRGLGMILISQRSAKVAKDVLTQAPLLFLHKVVHPADMKVYKDLIPLPPSETERIVGALLPGQAVVMHNYIPQVTQIRRRHTFHAGSTPVLGEIMSPELRKIDEALLRELQQMLAQSSPVVKDERRLEKRVKELEATVETQRLEIERLMQENAMLSKLSVSMDGKIENALQLPETMQIAQATIGMATVHQVHTPPTPPTVVEAQARKPLVSLQSPVLPVHDTKLQALKRLINQLSRNQYRVFKTLMERNETLTIDGIAAWMCVSTSTVRRALPPDAFFKIGLVKRYQSGNSSQYRSTIREHLAREFPNGDVEQLQRSLFERK